MVALGSSRHPQTQSDAFYAYIRPVKTTTLSERTKVLAEARSGSFPGVFPPVLFSLRAVVGLHRKLAGRRHAFIVSSSDSMERPRQMKTLIVEFVHYATVEGLAFRREIRISVGTSRCRPWDRAAR